MRVTRRVATALMALVVVLAAAAAQQPPRQPRPPQNQVGPWELDLQLRVGQTGESFGEPELFCQAAGVPSAVIDGHGRITVVFQWFPDRASPHWDRVARKTSDDGGRTWTEPEPLVFEGLPEGFQRPFDPTLVPLPDGRMRIYFSSGPRAMRPDQMQPATYSAISGDGLNFTFEPGSRFSVLNQRVIDPAVLLLNGVFQLTAPIGKPEDGAYHATSTDGLTFERQADIASVNGVNWTGNLLRRGDGLRFYGGSRNGIWYADSDDGATWRAPQTLGFQGGDPTVVKAEDDRFLLISVGVPPRQPGRPQR